MGESVAWARSLFDDLHELSESSELSELSETSESDEPHESGGPSWFGARAEPDDQVGATALVADRQTVSWAGELRRIVAGAFVTVVVASVAVVALVAAGLAGGPHPARGPAASPVAGSGRVVAPGLAGPVSSGPAVVVVLRR